MNYKIKGYNGNSYQKTESDQEQEGNLNASGYKSQFMNYQTARNSQKIKEGQSINFDQIKTSKQQLNPYSSSIKTFQQKYNEEKKQNIQLNSLIKSKDNQIKYIQNQVLRLKKSNEHSQLKKLKQNIKTHQAQIIKFKQEHIKKDKLIDQQQSKIKQNQTTLQQKQKELTQKTQEFNNKIQQNQTTFQKKQRELTSKAQDLNNKIQQISSKFLSKQNELTQKAQEFNKKMENKILQIQHLSNQLCFQKQKSLKFQKSCQIQKQYLYKQLKIKDDLIKELKFKLNKEKKEQGTEIQTIQSLSLTYAFSDSNNMFSMCQLFEHAVEIQPQKLSISDIRLIYKYKTDKKVQFFKRTLNKKNLLLIAKTKTLNQQQIVGGFTSCGFEQNLNVENYGFLFSTDKMGKLNFFDLKSSKKKPSQNTDIQIKFGWRELVIKEGNLLQTDFGNFSHQSRGHYKNQNKLKRNQFIISQNQQFESIQLEDYEIYQIFFENQKIINIKDYNLMIEKIKNDESQMKKLRLKDLQSRQILKEKDQKMNRLVNQINLEKKKQKGQNQEVSASYQRLVEQSKIKANQIESLRNAYQLKLQQKSNQIWRMKSLHKEKVQEAKTVLTKILGQMI